MLLSKKLIFSSLSLLFIVIFGGLAYASSATQNIQGTTNKSIYKVNKNIDITGTVNGDVFCLAQTININATINGDIICGGQTININGTVNGNIRVAGQTVNLGAKVTKSATIAGQDVNIQDNSNIGQDLSSASQNLNINGSITRDVNAVGGDITINSSVSRNVTLHASSVNLDENTKINGDLTYTSPHELKKFPGAEVKGTVSYNKTNTAKNHSSHSFIFFKIYAAVTFIVASVVIVALFPRLFKNWNPKYGSGFWWSLLVGLIAMIAVPLISLLLFISVIGIPLGIILMLLWLISLFIGSIFAAYFVGSLITPKIHPVLIVLIGSIIIGLIELIPIIGVIISLLTVWAGSGILLRGLWRSYPKPDYK